LDKMGLELPQRVMGAIDTLGLMECVRMSRVTGRERERDGDGVNCEAGNSKKGTN